MTLDTILNIKMYESKLDQIYVNFSELFIFRQPRFPK